MHQNSPTGTYIFKNFPGVTPRPDPHFSKGEEGKGEMAPRQTVSSYATAIRVCNPGIIAQPGISGLKLSIPGLNDICKRTDVNGANYITIRALQHIYVYIGLYYSCRLIA
jgi:hypothetical protein